MVPPRSEPVSATGPYVPPLATPVDDDTGPDGVTPPIRPVDLSKLHSLLARWAEAHDRGTPVAIAELTDDPVLRAELARRIAAEGRPPRSPQLTVPDVPGYEILGELGRGGMGVVYRAQQTGLNRPVALKMVLAGDADPREVRRFLSEAEAVAAVRHPHVVGVYEVGEAAGRPYLALEYCAGGTLAGRLRADGQLRPREAAGLVARVARGVGAAHVQGIVHRDLKPGNVLFDDQGEPKVADFGLAKLGAGRDVTETGMVLGTPAYMSPEQARGQGKYVGPPADVWALGVILYECLTSTRPFAAADTWALLKRIVESAPATPRSVVRALPRDLETVCLRCLAKDPRDRYPTADDLADDLDRFLANRPVLARPAGPAHRAAKWARRNPGYAGLLSGLAVVLVAASIVSTVFGLRAKRETVRANGEAWNATQAALLADANAKEAATNAHTAEVNAGAARKSAADAQREQVRADARTTEARDLLGKMAVAEGVKASDGGNTPVGRLWYLQAAAHDPDNTGLADATRMRVALYDRFTPAARPIEVTDPPPQHAFTKSWEMAAGPGTRRLRRARDRTWEYPVVEGPDQRVIATLRPGRQLALAVFSPDGSRVLTLERNEEEKQREWNSMWAFATGRQFYQSFSVDLFQVRLWDATNGRLLLGPLWHPTARQSQELFSADGRRVAIALTALDACRVFDAATGQPVGPNIPLAPGARPAFSRDGRRVAGRIPRDTAVGIWEADTGLQVATCPHDDGAGWLVRFTPDGKQLLTIGKATNTDLRFWDASTGKLLFPPLQHGDSVADADFSPDGRRFLTTCNDQTARVWDRGTGIPVTPWLRHEGTVSRFNFSPDGQLIALWSQPGGIRVWETGTGAPASPPLPVELVNRMEFSPDNRVLTAELNSGQTVRWDLSRPTGPTPLRQFQSRRLVFSSDTRLLAAASTNEIRIWDTGTGRLVCPPIRNVMHPAHLEFDPTGRWLLAATSSAGVGIWRVADGCPAPLATGLLSRVGFNPIRLPVAFRPDGKAALTLHHDGKVRQIDLESGTELHPPVDPGGPVQAMYYAPNGGRFVLLTTAGIRLWDTVTGRAAAPVLGPPGPTRAAFDPTGSRLVVAYPDDTIRLWDPVAGRESGPALAAKRPVSKNTMGPISQNTMDWNRLDFSPDGTRLLLRDNVGPASLWDVATGRPLALPPGRPTGWDSLQWTRDLRRFVRRDTNSLIVAEAGETGTERVIQTGAAIRSFALSPNGRWVAAGTEAGVARIWDAVTGKPITPPFGHDRPVVQVAFSPDGRWLLTRSQDHSARLWDAATGQPVSPRWAFSATVSDISFCREGTRLVMLSPHVWEMSTHWVLNIETSAHTPADLVPVARLLAGGRSLDSSGVLLPADVPLGRLLADARASFPADFALPAGPVRNAHWRQGRAADRREDWFAAAFHWRALTALEPGNADWKHRLAEAEARRVAPTAPPATTVDFAGAEQRALAAAAPLADALARLDAAVAADPVGEAVEDADDVSARVRIDFDRACKVLTAAGRAMDRAAAAAEMGRIRTATQDAYTAAGALATVAAHTPDDSAAARRALSAALEYEVYSAAIGGLQR